MALVDHIVVMETGHIAQTGAPREIYFQPTNRYVADFIGTMNRLDGTREDDAFVCAGGRVPVPAGNGNTTFFRPEDAMLVDPIQVALKDTVKLALFLGFRTRIYVVGVSVTPLFIDTPGHQQFALGHTAGFDIPVDHPLTLQA